MPKRKPTGSGPSSELTENIESKHDGDVAANTNSNFKNKERVLIVSSRGITFRFRHLLLDLLQLIPHSKKDAKLDTKSERGTINEVAELKGATSALFFETRKHKDLYLWAAKTQSGPTVKFHVTNIHTMAELKLSGNHLKGSRPVLSFDAAFNDQPHFQVIKELLSQIFATPNRHHKAKPFFDHVISFTIADGRIWMRNYQVVPDPAAKQSDFKAISLVEVGPRACMNPILIMSGGFGGPIVYSNAGYVSPNAIRAALKKKAQTKYISKVNSRQQRKEHKESNTLPLDELNDVFK